MNDKEARNKLKELAKIPKAKEMTKLKEGNIILKQLRNENALRKAEEKTKLKEGQEILKTLKKTRYIKKS